MAGILRRPYEADRYRGYHSYDYLVPGKDHRVFELVEELDRVPSRQLAISEAEEARVQQLLQQGPVISFYDQSTASGVVVFLVTSLAVKQQEPLSRNRSPRRELTQLRPILQALPSTSRPGVAVKTEGDDRS